MAPRGHSLPQATTESAREARKSFFCELCQKGYARMNEFEAHEGSYDHQHRKRLKEMKQLTKDPNATSKAERERKANEEAGLKSINLNLSGTSGGSAKKKPVFKSTLQRHNAAALGQTPSLPLAVKGDAEIADDGGEGDVDLQAAYRQDPSQAITNGWDQDRYDPRFPTCLTNCRRCQGGPCRHANRDISYDRNETWGNFVKRTAIAPGK